MRKEGMRKARAVMKTLPKKQPTIKIITFACEGGMVSSVVGATLIRKKLREADLTITLHHSSIHDISEETDLIVIHEHFIDQVKNLYPNHHYFSLQSYLHQESYNRLVQYLTFKN
jgi:mannitol PTS system EIICBA or EIICB component